MVFLKNPSRNNRAIPFGIPQVVIPVLVLFGSIIGCKSPDATIGPRQIRRPNILWITCEDMSPRLGAYGDSIAFTPNIDRLAEESVLFTNAFSISGVCAPSRAALIMGLYPTSFGALHMRTIKRTAAIAKITDPDLLAIPVYEAVPPPEARCFSEILRLNGYYCTNNSKNDYQFHAPVTAWDENSDQAHYKNRADKSQPFFSVFNILDSHESKVWVNADSASYTDPLTIKLPPYYPDNEIIRKDLARHYDNIRMVDRKVGQLLAELEASGEADNTIVFFFSDHGDGLPRAKRWIYDSGIKVPLMVRYPDRKRAGKKEKQLVSFVDFAPTVLSLAEVPIPAYMQGRAFLGPSADTEPREYIFAARDRMDPVLDYVRGIRDVRYKLIKNYLPNQPYVQFLPYRDQMPLMQELLRLDEEGLLEGIPALWFAKQRPELEFYDTWEDPHEINNLADAPEHAARIGIMLEALTTWEQKTGDMGGIPEPELVKRLWPPDGMQPVTEACTSENIGPDKMAINSITSGASIAYQLIHQSDTSEWMIYTEPVDIREGQIRAIAHRIGYMPSAMVTIDY
jgi:arylsulfatase A-like enzyme